MEFDRLVKTVCETYEKAPERAEKGIHTVCTDEKTGIQALERLNPTLPMKPGLIERREHSYKRHGTVCLTPIFDVATGKVLYSTIEYARTEKDFAAHIK